MVADEEVHHFEVGTVCDASVGQFLCERFGGTHSPVAAVLRLECVEVYVLSSRMAVISQAEWLSRLRMALDGT